MEERRESLRGAFRRSGKSRLSPPPRSQLQEDLDEQLSLNDRTRSLASIANVDESKTTGGLVDSTTTTAPDVEYDDEQDNDESDTNGFLSPGLFRGFHGDSSRDLSININNNNGDYHHHQDMHPSLQKTPVVYRYYSRNRARTANAGSIPFILLGPNVDHWKVAGQELAARGFNVMAVERVQQPEATSSSSSSSSSSNEKSVPAVSRSTAANQHYPERQGADLVLELLDALRWTKVVLVGCDAESALAIRAAMLLAPDRVAGLVLCGNLERADDWVASLYYAQQQPSNNRRLPGFFAVDRFLQSNLPCPFQIVWDGDIPPPASFSGSGMETMSSSEASPGGSTGHHRSVVLGGGSAPHRRRPELFSWVLTRFVEENIAPSSQMMLSKRPQPREQKEHKPNESPKNILFVSLSEFLSEGSLVVWGRTIAATVFYGIMIKVVFFQYDSVRGGIFSIRAGFDAVTSLRRHLFGAVTSFLGSLLGSMSIAFRRGKSLKDTESDVQVPADDHSPKNGHDEQEESTTSTEEAEEEPEEEPEDEPEDKDEPPETPVFKPFFFLDHVIA